MACVQAPCPTKLPDAREVRADHSHVPADSWSDDVNHIVSDLATFPFHHRAVSQVSGSALNWYRIH